MRKHSYIARYNHNDERAYNFLRNCCYVKEHQLKTFISSENRLKAYEHQHIIERVDTSTFSCYRLTEIGKHIFEHEFGKQGAYYHSQSPDHDVVLAQRYVDLYVTYGDNFEWHNETDLRSDRLQMLRIYSDCRENALYDRLERSSLMDCVYTVGGVDYAYDITTDNYSQSFITSKADFCGCMGIDHIEFQHI